MVVFLLKSLSNGITDILIESGAVPECKRKLYHYCISGIVEMGANLLITLAFGLVLGRFVETLLFLLIMLPFRTIAGGYHADSGRACFVISLLVYGTTLLLSSIWASFGSYIYSIGLYIISVTVMLVLTPVDSKNKRLNANMKRKQKIKCLRLLLLFSVLFSLFCLINIRSFAFLMSCCMAAVAALLVAGKIKNYRSGV